VDAATRRLIKVLRFGKSDVQTPFDVSPFGIDGHAIKDMIAVYSETGEKGKAVIVGYINKNKLAGVGELRLFSTDQNGSEKFYVWLKNDGFLELGGAQNFAVKFNELKTEFNSLKESHNNLLTEYIAHVHTGGTISGSTGTTVSTQTPNAANIDNAKNEKIKTI
jgi:hypothetical protein